MIIDFLIRLIIVITFPIEILVMLVQHACYGLKEAFENIYYGLKEPRYTRFEDWLNRWRL